MSKPLELFIFILIIFRPPMFELLYSSIIRSATPHPILLMASLQAFQDVFWSHYKVSALSTSVDVSDDVILEDVKFYGMFFFCYAAYFRAVKRISLDSFSKFPGCTIESVVCGGAFSVSCPYLIYYAAQLTNCFEISGFTEKILQIFQLILTRVFITAFFIFLCITTQHNLW